MGIRSESNGKWLYPARVTSTAVSTVGDTVVIGRSDGKLLLWNQRGKIIHKPFSADDADAITAIAVCRDRNTIVTAGVNGTVSNVESTGADPSGKKKGSIVEW